MCRRGYALTFAPLALHTPVLPGDIEGGEGDPLHSVFPVFHVFPGHPSEGIVQNKNYQLVQAGFILV